MHLESSCSELKVLRWRSSFSKIDSQACWGYSVQICEKIFQGKEEPENVVFHAVQEWLHSDRKSGKFHSPRSEKWIEIYCLQAQPLLGSMTLFIFCASHECWLIKMAFSIMFKRPCGYKFKHLLYSFSTSIF